MVRKRNEPVSIEQRKEIDPADRALMGARPDVTKGDVDVGGMNLVSPVARQATGDTDRGDSGSPERHGDSDTTTGDRGAVTPDQRQRRGDSERRGDERQRHGDRHGDSDMPTPTATDEGRQVSDSDPATAGRQASGDTSADADATAELTTSDSDEPMRSRSFSFNDSLFARLRSAVHYTQIQQDGYPNVSALVRAVVRAEVERLEDAHNRGRPFPPVERLRTGPSPEGAMRGARLRARRKADTQKPRRTGRGGGGS